MRKLKLRLMEALEGAGIPVREAGVWTAGSVISEGQVYLALAGVSAARAGACRYLGLDERDREIYGMELTVEMKLSLLSPKQGGLPEAECFGEELLETLVEISGTLPLWEIRCQPAEYDSLRDCFRQDILVKTGVLAWGVREEEQILVEDFRLSYTRS